MTDASDLFPAPSGGGIKAVQRGTATIAASETTGTVSISAVDMSKAYLVFSYTTTAGSTDSPAQYFTSGEITSTTQITFYRQTSGSMTVGVRWQVTEFE